MNEIGIDKIIKEAKRIEEDSLHSSKGHFCAAQFWKRFHFWVGGPTAVIAAIAGISALKDSPVLAAILAILVTALTAVLTFVNPNDNANSHLQAGNAYNSLKNDSRIFYDVEVQEGVDRIALLTSLKELNCRRSELNNNSPQIPEWAFKKARKGIEEGEAFYKVDSSEGQNN
jgi:hypothetical protein